jgi:hypothetical protein
MLHFKNLSSGVSHGTHKFHKSERMREGYIYIFLYEEREREREREGERERERERRGVVLMVLSVMVCVTRGGKTV